MIQKIICLAIALSITTPSIAFLSELRLGITNNVEDSRVYNYGTGDSYAQAVMETDYAQLITAQALISTAEEEKTPVRRYAWNKKKQYKNMCVAMAEQPYSVPINQLMQRTPNAQLPGAIPNDPKKESRYRHEYYSTGNQDQGEYHDPENMEQIQEDLGR